MSSLSRPADDPSTGLVAPKQHMVGVEGAESGSGSAATVVTEPLEDRRGQGILATASAALPASIQKIQETSSFCGVGVCVCVCARAWHSYTFSLRIRDPKNVSTAVYVCAQS